MFREKDAIFPKKSNELVKTHLLYDVEENFRLAIDSACKAGCEIEALHNLLDQVWTQANK